MKVESDEMASDKIRIFVKLTKEEKELIQKRMKDAGIQNMSAYIRRIALNGYVIQVDMSDVKEILRLVSICSNNLNQYAKKANETGSIYLEDINELRVTQKEIVMMLGALLYEISKIK